MLCIVILGPSIEEARAQIKQATVYADLVELRLDCFSSRDPDVLSDLLKEFSIPMIFTIRSKSQGGAYKGSEEDRLQEIKQLAACRPAYLDLEWHVPQAFFDQMSRDFPDIKLIISYHDFNNSHGALDKIIDAMPRVKGALYKIATMAHSTADALRLMAASSKYQDVITISMGESGEVSRILYPRVKNFLTYSCLDESHASAPGQVPAQMLVDIYRIKSIHPNTGLYGLIGNRVTKSISHWTHNALMQAFNLDAVYVKMKVESGELQTTLNLMKTLGFRGLSVTMPLKEEILPYLDEIDPDAKAIGAVNTILFDQGRLIGYNMDGYGALESLEKLGLVKGKRVILIGAGGAARAIAFEAKRRGAHVIILNRTSGRAQQLALEFDCEADGLEMMPKYFESGYDILINCTPHSLPIDPKHFIKDAIVMDITNKPMDTLFLKAAQLAGCRIVYGYQMFVRQALKQFEVWFPGKLDEQKAYDILNRTAQNVIVDKC